MLERVVGAGGHTPDVTTAHRTVSRAVKRGIRSAMRTSWGPVGLPLALGVLVLLIFPRPAMWSNESVTARATTTSWGNFFERMTGPDAGNFGYYAATKTLASTLHVSELTAARSISAIFYLVAIAAIFMLAQRLWNKQAGSLAASAMALLPSTAAGSINARPETTSVALIALYLLASLHRYRKAQATIGMVACFFSAVNALYLPAALLISTLKGRKPSRANLLTSLGVSGTGLVWFLYCAAQRHHLRVGHDAWGRFTRSIADSLTRFGLRTPTSAVWEHLASGTNVLAVGAFAVGTIVLVRQPRMRRSALALAALWGLPILTAALAAAANAYPTLGGYLSPSSVPMALLLGFATTQLMRQAGRCR